MLRRCEPGECVLKFVFLLLNKGKDLFLETPLI